MIWRAIVDGSRSYMRAAIQIDDSVPRLSDGLEVMIQATEQASTHIREVTTAVVLTRVVEAEPERLADTSAPVDEVVADEHTRQVVQRAMQRCEPEDRALLAALYLAISPVFLYVGRFIRHDMYSIVFEMLTIIGIPFGVQHVKLALVALAAGRKRDAAIRTHHAVPRHAAALSQLRQHPCNQARAARQASTGRDHAVTGDCAARNRAHRGEDRVACSVRAHAATGNTASMVDNSTPGNILCTISKISVRTWPVARS